jgi:sugar phosphate isomerase/epimerase
MRIGIFAKTFAGRDPLTVLNSVKQAGYSCCQYNMACSDLPPLPPEISVRALLAIKNAVSETGVAISALSATYNMAHPEETVRKRGRAALKVLCKAAAELGIPMVTLCTGSRNTSDQWTDHPDNHLEETFFQICEEFEYAIHWADELGVDLGVEPEPGNVIRDAEVAARFLKEMGSSRIKIVFDPANLIEGHAVAEHHRVVADAFQALAPHVSLVHAKDRSASGAVVAAGQGVVDFPKLFGLLKLSGYSGDIVTHGLEAEQAGPVSSYLRDVARRSGLGVT